MEYISRDAPRTLRELLAEWVLRVDEANVTCLICERIDRQHAKNCDWTKGVTLARAALAAATPEREILDKIHDALGEARGSDDTELPGIIAELLRVAKERSRLLDAAATPAPRTLRDEAQWWFDEFVSPWKADDADGYERAKERLAALAAATPPSTHHKWATTRKRGDTKVPAREGGSGEAESLPPDAPRTLRERWSERERAALDELMQITGLTEFGVMRQGLRVYQLIVKGSHTLTEPAALAAATPHDNGPCMTEEERLAHLKGLGEALDATAATPASTPREDGVCFAHGGYVGPRCTICWPTQAYQRDRPAASDFCPKCHKLILEPDANYGVNPDVICMCAPQRDRQGQEGK